VNIQRGHYIKYKAARRAIYRVLHVCQDGRLTARRISDATPITICRPEQYAIIQGDPTMKLKLSLDNAKEQAAPIIAALTTSCDRIAIAGSIRRCAPHVGDVEIVAIPKYHQPTDLFGFAHGKPDSELDLALDRLVSAGIIKPGDKQGDRYKKFILPRFGLQLDLFITDPAGWGVIYTLRTGSKDFSHWLVTPRDKGGAMPFGLRCQDRQLWRQGRALNTPTERAVFDALEIPYISPPSRQKGHWRMYS
jgi:DNA polymerase/3'-5' exonuclease PolX